MPQRLLALLLCAALFIPSCALAEDTTPEPERFVAPTLPPDAIAWDSSHPDILDEDMLYARSAILIEANTGEVLFEKLLILQTADNMAKNLEHFPEKKNRIDASMQIYKQILAERQPYLVSHLAVNGKDLIRLGYRPGREIGDVLRKLIDEVIIDAKLNNRDYLLKEARILKKSNSKNGSQR